MENQFALFFAAVMTAVAVENVVFTRALGLSKTVMFINRPKTGMLYGVLLTWMVTVSTLLTSLVSSLLQGNPYAWFLYAPCYFLCVAVVYVFTYLFTMKQMPKLHKTIRRALPVTTFNSALFGVFYLTMSASLPVKIGYALGAGVGYTFAILIVYYARKRLAISPVPRSFRGLPILILYIGIISLAIYGLTGHGLPT